MERFDRLKGPKVIAELSFAVAKLARGELVCEFESLFEGERVSFDLNAGQGFANFGLAANLLDPFGLEADGGEESARALDGF